MAASASASLQSIPASSIKLSRTTGSAPNLLSFRSSVNPVFTHKLSANVNVSGTRKTFSVKSQSSPSDSSRPTKVHELCVYELNERDRGSPAYLRLGQKPVNSLGDLVPFTNKHSPCRQHHQPQTTTVNSTIAGGFEASPAASFNLRRLRSNRSSVYSGGFCSISGGFEASKLLFNHLLQTQLVYSADLQTRLGITAGICILIKNMPEAKGDRYEAIYSFHLGDYGQIAVQGAYVTTEDTYLTVTGGTGVFAGAYGQVKLQQLVFPFKLFYTFYLQGLSGDLPSELLVTPVTPSPAVEASPAAKACEAGATSPNYSN